MSDADVTKPDTIPKQCYPPIYGITDRIHPYTGTSKLYHPPFFSVTLRGHRGLASSPDLYANRQRH